MSKHNVWMGLWDVSIVGSDGKIKEEFKDLRNGLTDDGECIVLSRYFWDDLLVVGPCKVRLVNQSLTTASHYTETLANAEISGWTGGAYPPSITQDPSGWTLNRVTADGSWYMQSAELSLTAGASACGPFSCLFLTAALTWDGGVSIPAYAPGGVSNPLYGGAALLAYLNFPSRTILSGDTLKVKVKVTLT